MTIGVGYGEWCGATAECQWFCCGGWRWGHPRIHARVVRFHIDPNLPFPLLPTRTLLARPRLIRIQPPQHRPHRNIIHTRPPQLLRKARRSTHIIHPRPMMMRVRRPRGFLARFGEHRCARVSIVVVYIARAVPVAIIIPIPLLVAVFGSDERLFRSLRERR